MTQEQIENNKLIAEFMGFAVIQGDIYNIPTDRGVGYVPKFMKYHKSWDWLIPVVEKMYNVLQVVEDPNDDWRFDLHEQLLDINLEGLHELLVRFIKWYNENHKNNDTSRHHQ